MKIIPHLLRFFNSELFYLNPHPPPSNPCPALTSLGFASDWSREIERERQGCPTVMRPTILGDRRGPALPPWQRPLKQRSRRPADHLSPRLEITSTPTLGSFTTNCQKLMSVAPLTSWRGDKTWTVARDRERNIEREIERVERVEKDMYRERGRDRYIYRDIYRER